MKNMLIVVDECETTNIDSPVIRNAIEIACACSNKTWIVHVTPNSYLFSNYAISKKEIRHESALELSHEHEFIQQLSQCLKKYGINSQALLIEGNFTTTLLKEIDRLGIDLVIMGCHKHNLLGMLMEFEEENILSKCPCPVMFVPMPA